MTSNISRQGSECVRLWRCLCVRVCECCIAHTDPCLSGHILSISLLFAGCRSLFALAATGLLGFRCEGSNRVRSHVRVRACVHSWRLSCVRVQWARVVRVCVSSYFRHSHHGRLFLVLKDSVCMHVYMSTGICTHCADACVCVRACVRVCVCFGSGLASRVRRLWWVCVFRAAGVKEQSELRFPLEREFNLEEQGS